MLRLFVYNFQNKLGPSKRILALTTLGQKFTCSELKPFEQIGFDFGYPVYELLNDILRGQCGNFIIFLSQGSYKCEICLQILNFDYYEWQF